MSNYKSQHGQDKWLNENIFNGKSSGFFVEAGACDGVVSSNTYFFEKELGWRGLLIEPNLEFYSKIALNRGCKSCNYLLWEKEKELDYISYHRKGLSGVKGIKSHANRYLNQQEGNWDIITMNSKTLESVLIENNCPRHIELLSLDVEGAEEFILKSFNFNLFSFDALLIETRQSSFNFSSFLSQFGYKEIHKIEGDTIFTNQNRHD